MKPIDWTISTKKCQYLEEQGLGYRCSLKPIQVGESKCTLLDYTICLNTSEERLLTRITEMEHQNETNR